MRELGLRTEFLHQIFEEAGKELDPTKVKVQEFKDGHALVDIEIQGENQRGELTTPGLATVILPSLDPNTKVFVDGSGLDLELPVVR